MFIYIVYQDEINSIPFFDVQLPREIAILIFSYLDMKDLCNCSLVSSVQSQTSYLVYQSLS